MSQKSAKAKPTKPVGPMMLGLNILAASCIPTTIATVLCYATGAA